jgi:hypothetical protein
MPRQKVRPGRALDRAMGAFWTRVRGHVVEIQ